MKLKDWIRDKLMHFILIDKLQENFQLELNRLAREINNTDLRISRTVNENQKDIKILHNTLRNVVSVGADVRIPKDYDRSWAVICIEGNYNVVKFVDLHGADYRMILDFLKQYEGSRMCIDTPRGFMFEDAFRLK